jgi:hypothetical protein
MKMNENGQRGCFFSMWLKLFVYFSYYSWCRQECEEHPDVQTLLRKIEKYEINPKDYY